MSQSIWASRPADIYGRRKRDRLYTVLWGLGTLLGGFASATPWTPSRVAPVNRTHTAVVTKRELITPDVVALTFADVDGGLLPSWTPGSHIDVQLPSGRRRQYSLCGLPGRRTDYRIAVRRIADGGGGSIEMHEAFSVGDRLVFEGPRNAFYLGGHEHDVLFVIGGIGVTPILPMMRAAQQREMNWRAIYAGRGRDYMPLLDEVVSLAPDRVTVWADDERGGFATADDLLLGATPATAVYVCGPTPMLESVRTARDQTRECTSALRALQPAADHRRRPVPAGASAISARARRPCQPISTRRHARRRSDDRAFLPARLLRNLQGQGGQRRRRSPRPHGGNRRRHAGVRIARRRRPRGDRRVTAG